MTLENDSRLLTEAQRSYLAWLLYRLSMYKKVGSKAMIAQYERKIDELLSSVG